MSRKHPDSARRAAASSAPLRRGRKHQCSLVAISILALLSRPIRAVVPGIGYEAQTDVQQFLNLALDLKDMRLATEIDEKRRIYQQGNQGQTLTLQELSTNSESRYASVTIYNVYRHAFERLGVESENDALGDFDGKPEEIYADTIVDDLFRLNLHRIEADGALVMNVCMAVWGALALMLETCHLDPSNTDKMHGLLDEAAAYWVGAGQVKGDGNTGHSLYNLAEFAGVHFGQDQGEVRINTVFLEVMAFVQVDIVENKCQQNGSQGYVDMRKKVQLLFGLTNTVLVQMFLHHVQDVQATGRSDFCELFALALYPQIAACSPALADDLFDLAVSANVTATSRPTVIQTIQSAYSCLHVKCSDVGAYQSDKIPACDDDKVLLSTMAGYTGSSDVAFKAKIDRDISHIAIDLNYEAYRSALLTYNLGWHTNFALQSLATNTFTPLPNPIFDEFDAQFGKAFVTKPSDVIQSVLLGEKPFSGASSSQEGSLVEGLLRYVVMYVAALNEFDSAITACENQGSSESISLLWDGGAAFLIGSMEGATVGGHAGGFLLYGLANELCLDYGTCEPDDALVNGVIRAALHFGSEQLAENNCQNARTALEDTIRPNLQVPLIQAFLAYALDAEGDLDFSDIGFLDAFATALVPTFEPVDPQVAQLIATAADFEEGVAIGPVGEGIGEVFEYVKQVLPNLSTDCADVGKLSIDNVGRGVCPTDPKFTRTFDGSTSTPVAVPPQVTSAPVAAPTLTTPTTHAPIVVAEPHAEGLAWGRYTFVASDVAENDALFSLDIRDMFFAADVDAARAIYDNGKNVPNGLSGTLNIKSLKEFSTKASTFMREDPMYNFYRYSLYDDDSFDSPNGAGGWPFGDSVIALALGPENGNSPHLAAEAAVVINIWMMIAHRLHYSVRECATHTKAAAAAIDSAVGLWIGKEVDEGRFRSGYSMYSLAQSASRLYGNDEGEALVNSRLMQMFNSAQNHAKTCDETGSKQSETLLYHEIDDILNELGKPVLQMLLYFASQDETDPTELYGLSFLPRAISCDINAYATLRETFIQGYEKGTLTNEIILKDLAEVMHCFRYTCDDLGDVSKLGEDHAQLISGICDSLNNDFDNSKLAGYQTSRDVSEVARLDLDLHQMDLMMRVGAYTAAKEIYTHGRNGRKIDDTRYTLQELALNSNAGPLHGVMESYYKSATYAEDQVAFAFDPEAENRFKVSSRRQRAEFAFRSVQSITTYKAVSSNLAKAVLECKAGNGADTLVDEAAAIFVGSIEGSSGGGSRDGSGVMLMSLAKEHCQFFNKCENHGDATSNEFILFAMSDVKESLEGGNCTKAEEVISERIEPMLPVPMIQASLYYSHVNEALPAGDSNRTLASADILSKAILPKVDALNVTSGSVILENSEFNPAQKPVIDGTEAVFSAYRAVLGGLEIDCDVVGVLVTDRLSLCDLAPHAETPTNLGGDLYITSTYVDDRAGIALDVKEMEEELVGDQKVLASLIYEEGEHSPIFDENGIKIGRRSLAGFSVNADSTMGFNPLFQIAKYALSDGNGNYLGTRAARYADTIVRDSFNEGGKTTLAAEAAVALNLWMELANELFETVQRCENGNFKDDDGIHSIDEAAAYWIGDGQIAGNAEEGHLLYRLAEEMGKHFNVIEGSGQSRTNTNVLRLFHEAKLELSFPGACSADGTTKKRLRHTANKITSQMLVVNAQALIHYLRTGDRKRVKVYAHGYVPFVVACSPTTFAFLREQLLDVSYAETAVESIIRALENTLQCFDISCDDLGVHSSQSESTCEDPDDLTPLAGYRPEASVRQASLIDHDVAELDILMRMGALEAAEDLYTNGKHAKTGLDSGKVALSLHHLATSNSRTAVPEFDAFQRYFGADTYADDIIRQAFVSDNGMQDDQRRQLVVGTSQYMVMLMAALESMHAAIASCDAGATSDEGLAHTQWDTAAAYLIGDMEGSGDGGSQEGRLLWALAKRECNEFGTCSQLVSGSAQVNDQITSLLYTGRGAITGNSCDVLRKSVDELSDVILIPLFQGAMSAIVEIHDNRGARRDQVHAEAHVYSQAVLPLVATHDQATATIISENVDFAGEPLSSGLGKVASAFVIAIDAAGIDCTQIGASSRISGCTGLQGSNKEGRNLSIILGVLFGSLLAVGIVILVRRKKRKSLETKPTFIEAKGVMNHNDVDDRPESAPFNNGLDRITETDSVRDMFPDASAASDEDHSESVV